MNVKARLIFTKDGVNTCTQTRQKTPMIVAGHGLVDQANLLFLRKPLTGKDSALILTLGCIAD